MAGSSQEAKLDIGKIKELALKDKLAFKKHTVLRMRQRKITADEVKEALKIAPFQAAWFLDTLKITEPFMQ